MNNLNFEWTLSTANSSKNEGVRLASSLNILDEKSAENQGSGVAVRAYTDALLSQANANFGGAFSSIQTDINRILGNARNNATHYNITIQPNIFSLLGHMETYLHFQNAVTNALQGTDVSIESQIVLIDELTRRASNCYQVARATQRELGLFHDAMLLHRREMTEASQSLAQQANVSQNLLTQMRLRIEEKRNRILELEERIRNIGIGRPGGFIRRVGRVARFIVGVIWIIVISAVTISNNRETAQLSEELAQTQDEKTDIYLEYSQTSGHVTLAEGFGDCLSSLDTTGGKAERGSSEMAMAWNAHAAILYGLKKIVVLGDDPIFLRIALKQAQQSLEVAISSLESLRGQMIGVQAPPPNQEITLSSMIRESLSQAAVQHQEETRVNELKQRCIEEVKRLIDVNR